MPQMKKLSLDAWQLQQIAKTLNSQRVKKTLEERFKEAQKKDKIRKFFFKGIIEDDLIYLFDGIGNKIDITFPNTRQGRIDCRVFALYEIFLKTPEEQRNVGGYHFDFVE